MLTRLKVSGFKNLSDVDVRLGAFTCIAGANGVGKSNLFDAIRFLSDLADYPLIDAATSVRDENSRAVEFRRNIDPNNRRLEISAALEELNKKLEIPYKFLNISIYRRFFIIANLISISKIRNRYKRVY